MRVYDIHDEQGRVLAFEVSNFLSWKVVRIISDVPGARITWEPPFFCWFSSEVICKFEVDGVAFEVWEPFGDNSRYWVGPDPAQPVPQIEKVREAFLQAKWYELW